MGSFEQMTAAEFRASLNLPPAGKTEVTNKVPRQQNKSKEKLALDKLIRDYCANWNFTVQAEFIFHPVRKWRLDWYVPEVKVGIEFQGLDLGHAKNLKNGHQTAVGRTNDCQKANQAQILGITILQYTALNDQWKEFAEDFWAIVKAWQTNNFNKR